MKRLVFLLFAMICLKSASGQVRQWFDLAASDENLTEKIISYTQPHVKNNVVFAGYNGAARMIMAKHKFNPMAKWETFSKGKKILEGAISKDPGNVELIFLRLTIQENVPAFLGYHESIQTDRSLLKNRLNSIEDKDLQNRIIRYLNAGKS